MAGISAGTLNIEIVAEVARLQEDMRKVQQSVSGMADGVVRSTRAVNDNLAGVSKTSGQARAGMQQLSFQLGDAATMFSMGSSATQIFASQLGQTVQAVQLMSGGTSRLAAFLGGPWGMALSVGAIAMAPFVGKLWDIVTGAEAATGALEELIKKQRQQAQEKAKLSNAQVDLDKLEKKKTELEAYIEKYGVKGSIGQLMFVYSQQKALAEVNKQLAAGRMALDAERSATYSLDKVTKGLGATREETSTRAESSGRRNTAATRATAVAVNELAQSFKTLQRELMPEVAALEEYRSKLEQIAKFAKAGLITGNQADQWRKSLAMQGRPTDLVVASSPNSDLQDIAAQNVALMGERIGRGDDRSARGGSLAALEDYGADIADVGQRAFDAWRNAMFATEDALVNFAMTGKLAFKDLANSIIADLVRIAIQQAIMAPLTGAFKGLFSANGTAFDTGGVRKFAMGGVVSGPTPFAYSGGLGLMGEAGPEAIMPLRRLGNGRLGVEAAGGGSQSVTVNVNVEGGSQVQGDPGKASELGRLVGSAVQAELLRQKRPGGLLAA